MIKKNLLDGFKKGFNTLAVVTLLLPNIMSLGIVAAEETPADEPAVEDVVPEDVEESETVEENSTEEVDSIVEDATEENNTKVAPTTQTTATYRLRELDTDNDLRLMVDIFLHSDEYELTDVKRVFINGAASSSFTIESGYLTRGPRNYNYPPTRVSIEMSDGIRIDVTLEDETPPVENRELAFEIVPADATTVTVLDGIPGQEYRLVRGDNAGVRLGNAVANENGVLTFELANGVILVEGEPLRVTNNHTASETLTTVVSAPTIPREANQIHPLFTNSTEITGKTLPGVQVSVNAPNDSKSYGTTVADENGNFSFIIPESEELAVNDEIRVIFRDSMGYVIGSQIVSVQEEENEFGEPTEVRTLIYVRAPKNMTNYANTLNDFTAHPIILTNQVTGEVFRGTLKPDEGNTSNNFTFDTTVHAYERGNQPSGRYSITLPQELIDLGYNLTRDHSVQANFGIVGSTSLSYNAPQNNENLIQLSKATPGYDYFERQNLSVTFTSLDGLRTYTLNNSTISIPAGEYNFRITGSPTTSRPQLTHRDSSLRDAPQREISLTQDDDAYTGTVTFNDLNSTRPQIFSLSPIPLEVIHTVTIDPNGGTIDEAYASTEINEGETYTVPYTFQSNLARPGYTLTGYTVEGTLLDANGNEVTELSRFTGVYTPMSDVTLTANWEVTSGGFRIRDRIDGFITADRSFALTDGENTYPLTSNSYTNQYRTWTVDDVPNGVYTLLVDGVAYPNEWNLETTNSNSSASIADDGTVTVDLTFADNSTTTFVRFDLTMNEYEVGVEVRDLNNRRTSDVGIRVENEEGTVFEGSYDQYNLWTTNATVLPGLYTITLDTPDGTVAEINDTVASQVAEPTDEENVFALEVNRETKGNLSRVFGAFRLVAEEVETHPLGIEIRDLNGRRTSDVTIFVQNEDLVVFEGSFNQYAQWITDEELPVGEYTITLRTPENTYAVAQDTTQQHAVPTNRQNVFTILVNKENRGNLSRVFAAFQLVEMEFRLGVEVRGLDGRRTDSVGVVVTNEEGEIFAGSYNTYLQWITEEELPAGEYLVTLTTPEGTVAEINDIASNYANPTDEENVFTIQLSETNLGSSSTIYGAFLLVEVVTEPVETYEDITTTEPIAYETETRNNPNLPRGERRVVQVGVEGTRSVTERVYYEDGVEVRREIIDESTTPAVKEIIEVGTKSNLGTIVRKVVNVVTKVVKTILSWFF